MRSSEGHLDLLPWHVTGFLSTAHAVAVEDHLAWCSPCAKEARALASLRVSLVWQGLTDHPPPEEIISLEIGSGLDPLRRDAVAAHVEECGECRDDLGAVQRAHGLERAIEAGGAAAWRAESASPWSRRGLAATAAAAVIGLLIPMAAGLLDNEIPQPAGAEPIAFTPTVRGSDHDRALDGEGPWSIHVALPTDAPGGAYRFIITREATGFRRGAEEPVFAEVDGTLRLTLEPLPPGAGYVLLVWPAHGLESEAVEYPFHVTAAIEGREDPLTPLVGLVRRWRRSP